MQQAAADSYFGGRGQTVALSVLASIAAPWNLYKMRVATSLNPTFMVLRRHEMPEASALHTRTAYGHVLQPTASCLHIEGWLRI